MNTYCVKCRSKTQNRNSKLIRMANGKHRVSSTCVKCGSPKSQIVARKEGDGLLGNLLFPKKGKIPILSDIPLIGKLLF